MDGQPKPPQPVEQPERRRRRTWVVARLVGPLLVLAVSLDGPLAPSGPSNGGPLCFATHELYSVTRWAGSVACYVQWSGERTATGNPIIILSPAVAAMACGVALVFLAALLALVVAVTSWWFDARGHNLYGNLYGVFIGLGLIGWALALIANAVSLFEGPPWQIVLLQSPDVALVIAQWTASKVGWSGLVVLIGLLLAAAVAWWREGARVR